MARRWRRLTAQPPPHAQAQRFTLLADLDAGATGAMTGGAFADGLKPSITAHREGRRDEAFALYQRWLPLQPHVREGLLDTARRLDPLVLRWAGARAAT